MANTLGARAKLIPTLISGARIYYKYFVYYEYILLSNIFVEQTCYIIRSLNTNFLHLTGLKTNLSAQLFFKKCINGTISASDFQFKKGNSYNTCLLKLAVILDINNLFTNPHTLVQESFNKGLVSCSFAAENNVLTLGFIKDGEYSYPMTLQKGCFLDPELAGRITLLLRRPRKQKKFDDLVIGDITTLSKYYSSFKHLLSDRLLDLVASLNNDK